MFLGNGLNSNGIGRDSCLDKHLPVAEFATMALVNAIAGLPPFTLENLQQHKGCSEAIVPNQIGDIAMFKTVIAAAAVALLPTVAFADEAPKQSFTYQGVTYTYTSEIQNGVKVLKGSAYNGKVPFELKVTKNGVSGTFNRAPVDFDMHEVQHLDSKDIDEGQ